MKSLNSKLWMTLVLIMAAGSTGCYMRHAQQYYVYAPDMHFQPALKAQEPGAMRQPPKGTIPRDFRPYSITTMDEAKAHANPVVHSKENLQKGRMLYNTYCIVCHGQYGEGDGLVAAKKDWARPLFPRPPSLQSDKVRDLKDGQLFHIITMGQNLMPSYAEKMDNDERWMVVNFLRVLYRAKHPSADDLKKAETYLEDIGE